MGTLLAQTQSSVPAVQGTFLVDIYVKGFKVDFAGYLIPVISPDGTIFWDDDTLAGAKGVVLELAGVEKTATIDTYAWTSDKTVGDNAVAGTNGVTGSRVFIRTHNADGITASFAGSGATYVEPTLGNGAIGKAGCIIVVDPSPTATRALSGYFSGKMKPSQTATPTEVSYQVESYQQNVVEMTLPTDIALNATPTQKAANPAIFQDACGTTFVMPGADTNWNASTFMPNCDQGAPYTFATADGVGTFLPIGADTTAQYQNFIYGVFSYNV